MYSSIKINVVDTSDFINLISGNFIFQMLRQEITPEKSAQDNSMVESASVTRILTKANLI